MLPKTSKILSVQEIFFFSSPIPFFKKNLQFKVYEAFHAKSNRLNAPLFFFIRVYDSPKNDRHQFSDVFLKFSVAVKVEIVNEGRYRDF